MARVSLFNSPFLLGFDHIDKLLEDISRGGTGGYPPYNIEQTGNNALRITLAVAGFQPDELSVTIDMDRLEVGGRQADETDQVFMHRGIAARQFRRSFVLADGMEVRGAALEQGLLHIDLVRIEPEPRTRVIKVTESATGHESAEIKIGAGRGSSV